MELVPSFVEIVQRVSLVMTAPTFASFVIVLAGWVFARRHTVTRMILAADASIPSITRPFIASSPPPAGRWTNSAWPSSG